MTRRIRALGGVESGVVLTIAPRSGCVSAALKVALPKKNCTAGILKDSATVCCTPRVPPWQPDGVTLRDYQDSNVDCVTGEVWDLLSG